MSTQVFSTRAVPADQQLDAWRSWFEPVFDVAKPDDGTAQGFEAESAVRILGGAVFSQVTTPHIHAIRGMRNIRRDPVDHWSITVGTRETRLTLARGSLAVPASTPFVVCLGEPVESEREADERLQLYLPRDRFASLAPVLDQARGTPMLGPTGRLLADYLRLLARSLPGLPDEDLPRLSEPIRAMVAACVTPVGAVSELAAEQMDLTRLEQVRQAIRRRLSSATLTAGSLCREVGMSRSQLYRLLEGEGGVIHYIQRLRLQASHAVLSDPHDMRPIAAIAEACGFYDPSTFSRAFRREFGVAPSDFRVAARVGAAPATAWRPLMEAETRSLGACLRGY
ncbi:helix-turn-helix domain-containing protein [Roseomonas eburnea]|uniref:Helix-turn-helix domain-containing protein n=1 Tax=Neoroseomonas eburnea TaxID=1346889 RepID=A0A9X9XGF1_9PROT|nr:helix-turn-helix domain-containing protein [Neoroseomonas eburnea]MBR0682787.1 helix-turn-helix domain-containing protein [Neoroseomonas eburnea]